MTHNLKSESLKHTLAEGRTLLLPYRRQLGIVAHQHQAATTRAIDIGDKVVEHIAGAKHSEENVFARYHR